MILKIKIIIINNKNNKKVKIYIYIYVVVGLLLFVVRAEHTTGRVTDTHTIVHT